MHDIVVLTVQLISSSSEVVVDECWGDMPTTVVVGALAG